MEEGKDHTQKQRYFFTLFKKIQNIIALFFFIFLQCTAVERAILKRGEINCLLGLLLPQFDTVKKHIKLSFYLNQSFQLARLLSSSSGSGVSPSILTPSDYSFSFDSGLLQTQMDSGAPYLAFLGVQRNGFLKFLHLKRRPMTAMVVVKEEEEENELKAFLDQEVCNKTSAMFFKARLKEVRK